MSTQSEAMSLTDANSGGNVQSAVVLSRRLILQSVHATSEPDFNKWKLDMLSTIQSMNDQFGSHSTMTKCMEPHALTFVQLQYSTKQALMLWEEKTNPQSQKTKMVEREFNSLTGTEVVEAIVKIRALERDRTNDTQ